MVVLLKSENIGDAAPEVEPEETAPSAPPVPSVESYCDKIKADYLAAYRDGVPTIEETRFYIEKLEICHKELGNKYNPANYDVIKLQRQRLRDFGEFPFITVGILFVLFTGAVVAEKKGLFKKLKRKK